MSSIIISQIYINYTLINTDIYEHQKAITPKFTQIIKSGEQTIGEKFVFECQVQGSKPLSLAWFKEANLVDSTKSHKIVYEENTCKLIIPECTNDDSGLYTVVAKNKFGLDTCSAGLLVKGMFNESY